MTFYMHNSYAKLMHQKQGFLHLIVSNIYLYKLYFLSFFYYVLLTMNKKMLQFIKLDQQNPPKRKTLKTKEKSRFDCTKTYKTKANWWFQSQICKIIFPTSYINFPLLVSNLSSRYPAYISSALCLFRTKSNSLFFKTKKSKTYKQIKINFVMMAVYIYIYDFECKDNLCCTVATANAY